MELQSIRVKSGAQCTSADHTLERNRASLGPCAHSTPHSEPLPSKVPPAADGQAYVHKAVYTPIPEHPGLHAGAMLLGLSQ